MSAKILIIEDEEQIARLLNLELTHEGYEVETADNGRDGLEKALEGEWDVILLDIMLPGINGMEVLRRLRNTDELTPVILLSARDTTIDKVMGLDQGANDYLTKPFEIEELLARIRACIRLRPAVLERRAAAEEATQLSVDDLTIDIKTREVIREDQKIELTTTEFDLLVFLVERQNEVLSREDIISQVWGYDFVGDTNIVDVYIRYLRKKIDHDFSFKLIQTIRGVGYTIRGQE